MGMKGDEGTDGIPGRIGPPGKDVSILLCDVCVCVCVVRLCDGSVQGIPGDDGGKGDPGDPGRMGRPGKDVRMQCS